MVMWGYPLEEMATVALARWQHEHRAATIDLLNGVDHEPNDNNYIQFKKALGHYNNARYSWAAAPEYRPYLLAAPEKYDKTRKSDLRHIVTPDACEPQKIEAFFRKRIEAASSYVDAPGVIEAKPFLEKQNYPEFKANSCRNLMKRVWLVCAECAVAINCEIHLSGTTKTSLKERESKGELPLEKAEFINAGRADVEKVETAFSWMLDLAPFRSEDLQFDTWPQGSHEVAVRSRLELIWDHLQLCDQCCGDNLSSDPLRDLAVILTPVPTTSLEMPVLLAKAKSTWLGRSPLFQLQKRGSAQHSPVSQAYAQGTRNSALYDYLKQSFDVIKDPSDGKELRAFDGISAGISGTGVEAKQQKLISFLEKCQSLDPTGSKDTKYLQKHFADLMVIMTHIRIPPKVMKGRVQRNFAQRIKNTEQFLNKLNSRIEISGDLLANDLVDAADALTTCIKDGDDFWGNKHMEGHATISNWAGAPGLLMSLYSFGGMVRSFQELKPQEAAVLIAKGTYAGAQFAQTLNWMGALGKGKEAAKTFSDNCTSVAAMAAIVAGTVNLFRTLNRWGDISLVGKRWEIFQHFQGPGAEELRGNDIYQQFKKCVKQIGRRWRYEAADAVGTLASTSSSVIAFVGTVGLASVTTPIGWAFVGTGLFVGLGIVVAKGIRRRYKERKWLLNKTRLVCGNLPGPPWWCETTGDYYRFVVAMYIYEAVLDLHSNPDANEAGKLMAWVLFGGNDKNTAAAEAAELGLAGIIGYIKG